MANTLYEFYTGQGQSLPSVQERAKIYESSGLGSGYVGSAGQNTALLNALSAGATQTQPQAQPQQQPQTQPSNVGVAQQYQSTGQPGNAQDLINMGYGGYAGWNDTEALADYKATGGQGKMTNGGGSVTQAPPIDLTNIYDNLYNEQGINDLQAQLNTQTQSFNQAVSKINDNPYLSEANRVGRVQKLTIDYNNSIKNLQDQIAQRTANVETKLGLATKQYDMTSQAQQTAFSQLNSLLSSGALDSASGSTIASLARSTGLSTDVINSAIQANKNKNVNTQLIQSEDDNGNVTISVIDGNTGDIIRQTSLGAVGTKTKTSGGGGGGLTPTQERAITTSARQSLIEVDGNEDKLVSAEEYIQAVERLMIATGIDEATADEYLSNALTDLQFGRWNW